MITRYVKYILQQKTDLISVVRRSQKNIQMYVHCFEFLQNHEQFLRDQVQAIIDNI